MAWDKIVGMGLDLATAKWQDKRQREQQQAFTDMQLEANKEMARQNQAYAMEMLSANQKWNSADAQVKRLEEAGLSPGLMYGKGGAGGMLSGSSGSGSGVSGGQAAPTQQLGYALQLAQLGAVKAQTKKTEAEASKIEGVDTEEARSRIQDIGEGIENKRAQRRLTNAQTEFQELQNEITNRTKDYTVDQIIWETETLAQQFRSAFAQAEWDASTFENRVNIVNTELLGLRLENALKSQNIKKTKHEINAISQGVLQEWEKVKQGWKGLEQKDRDLRIKEFTETIKAEYPSIFEVMGSNLQKFMQGLIDLGGGMPDGRKWTHDNLIK